MRIGRLWYKHRWGFGGSSVDLTDILVTMTKADGSGPFSFKIQTEAGPRKHKTKCRRVIRKTRSLAIHRVLNTMSFA